ncbi:MAG: acyl carrier protein [Micromonosporaceae bacterium]|nr:acyl carrier protein [Micromonosporaceae bacterium]
MRGAVRENLVEFIVNNYLFGEDTRTPGDDDSLIEAGIVDSTGILELIEFLETRFGIEVLDSETIPQNLGSIGNLVSFVEEKQGASGKPA